MAQAYKGKRVEVEILTNACRIWGTLFLPLAGEGAYAARLSDFLNNPDRTFLSLTDVKVEPLNDSGGSGSPGSSHLTRAL
jgi:hypothetical protein